MEHGERITHGGREHKKQQPFKKEESKLALLGHIKKA